MASHLAKLALALLILALTTAAHAGGADKSSLLQCGVNLGGKTLTYQAGPETKDRRDKRMNHVMGAVSVQPLQFTPVIATDAMAATTNSFDTRLPPKFTLAIIGCSWL